MSCARSEYQRLCQEHGTKTVKDVLKQLSPAENTDRTQLIGLDFSGITMSTKMWEIIGRLLQRDRSIIALKAADSYLSEDRCQALCCHLASNFTLTTLNLKGNGLRAKGASTLSIVLKRNKSIQCLSLEWNSFGMDEDAFAMLMEGLAVNTSVLHLDLRNNHITHLGGRQIATALTQNQTLQELDLSWNHCGTVGGKALLDSLHKNRTVAMLELCGNNIPDDITTAIGLALQRNVDRHQLESTYSNKTQHLSQALDKEMLSKKKEISSMLDKLEAQRSAFDKTLQASQERIVELQQDLGLREEEIEQLQARMSSTETTLRVSEDQGRQYQNIVEQLRTELAATHEVHLEELSDEKDKYHTVQMEKRATEKLAVETTDSLREKVALLDRSKKQLTAAVTELHDEKKQLELQLQRLETSFQTQLLSLEQRHTKTLQEQQSNAQEELNRSRHTAAGREHALQEQLRQAELKHSELEQELSRLKTSSLSARESLVADQKAQLQQIKNEHKLNIRHFEERSQQLQVELDTKQSQIIQATSTANQLQARLTAVTQESMTEKQTLQEHVKKLESAAEENRTAADTERRERRDAVSKSQELHDRCRHLEQELVRQKTKLTDVETQHIGQLATKERDIATLTERADGLSKQLQRQRDGELQRAGQLESALTAFVSNTKSAHI